MSNAPQFQIGDKVRVTTGHGFGLNRAFKRACTKRRPPVIVNFLGDAALLEVVKGTTVMRAWVNRKEIVHVA